MLHTKAKGTIGELAVAKHLIESGHSVFTEYGDLSKVDLIVLAGTRCLKVQVKSLAPKNSTIEFDLRKSGPNYRYKYQKTDVDIFAIHNPETGEMAFLSWEDLKDNGSSMSFRVGPTRNSQLSGCRNFADYAQFDRVLEVR